MDLVFSYLFNELKKIFQFFLNLILITVLFLQYQFPAFASTDANYPRELPSEAINSDYSQNGHWSPIVSLRDNTNTFPGSDEIPKPEQGWWVAPIHANLLPNGKVLVTGWSRPKESGCGQGEGRRFGTSFLLDPDQLTTIDGSFNITPIDEHPQLKGDVLYCSGHAPLPDGSILFMGGAKYTNLGEENQDEFGLNYARVFNGQKFSRVAQTNPGGPAPIDGLWDWYKTGMMWYPSITRLPEGKNLINGGLVKWTDILDQNKSQYLNKSVTIFDSSKFKSGQNPWQIWVNDAYAPYEVGIDVFDYPHSWLLPKPVKLDGYDRHVVIYGGIATAANGSSFIPGLAFLSLDKAVPEEKRFVTPPSGRRPKGGLLNDTTAFMTTEGHIIIMGGGNNGLKEGQRIDKFNPYTMTWDSLDAGITRHRAASTLLPDGTTLIVNGEQFYQSNNNIGDLKKPMIYDPNLNKVDVLDPWTSDDKIRGYHNISLLLKDGRVLIGGGRIYENAQEGQYKIGCERPELRIFSPPYLFQGTRPEIIKISDNKLIVGQSKITIEFSSASIPYSDGVVLMSMGSMTHSFDQNQRRIVLQYQQISENKIEVMAPEDSFVAPEGMYNLFLISNKGVPSISYTVTIGSP